MNYETTNIDESLYTINNDEISESEKDYRKETLDYLENKYPVDSSKFTSKDALNLSIINATLAVIDKYPDTSKEEHDATKAGLEMEQKVIVDKLVKLVTDKTIKEAFTYPTDTYIYQGLEPYTHIIEKVDYLANNTDDEEDIYTPGINNEEIVNKLISKVNSGEASPKEMIVALELAENICRFSSWRKVANQCENILQNGTDTGSVEQLIQLIHQGGYEGQTNANQAARPILEHISDRPWEVANTLTYIFAGYPSLASQEVSSSVSKWIRPNRELPIVREYFHTNPLNMRLIAGATREDSFLQACLSLSKEIPLENLEQESFFMDPFTASDKIEGIENGE